MKLLPRFGSPGKPLDSAILRAMRFGPGWMLIAWLAATPLGASGQEHTAKDEDAAPAPTPPAPQNRSLGLDRLLSTGEGGDYGVKDGAEPLPPPT